MDLIGLKLNFSRLLLALAGIMFSLSMYSNDLSYNDNLINNAGSEDRTESSNDSTVSTSEHPDVNIFNDVFAYLDQESLESQEAQQKQKKTEKQEVEISETDYKRDESGLEEGVSLQEEVREGESTQTSDIDFEAQDPYIEFNREMYAVNKEIDRYLIKPPARVYSYVAPAPVKHMVTNFFENLQDINVLINYFLQLDVENSVDTIYRLALNSSFGLLGLVDVATDAGFPKKQNDFGITFGKWFGEESPYFVIPLLGPSTIRDTVGKGVGAALSLNYYLPDDYVWVITATGIIDKRANLLSVEKIIDTVSDDEYIFVRNSYLTYRRSLILGDKPDVKREQKEQELLDDILSTGSSSDKTDSTGLEELDDLEELDELKDLE